MRRFVMKKTSALDEPIERVLYEMTLYGPDTDEYPALVEHLERLMTMKAQERKSRVSPDTMAMVVGNLLGILVIVAYEQKHVMVSKGLSFVFKAKPD